MWDSIKSFWLSTPTSTPTPPTEEEEEDLGENIEEKQDEEEEEEENEDDDSSSPGEVFTETSPFTGFSEPEKVKLTKKMKKMMQILWMKSQVHLKVVMKMMKMLNQILCHHKHLMMTMKMKI